MFNDTTTAEINIAMQEAWKAFHIYRKCSLKQRADFMRAIAKEIENLGDELLITAGKETNLPEGRLRNGFFTGKISPCDRIFIFHNFFGCAFGDYLTTVNARTRSHI